MIDKGFSDLIEKQINYSKQLFLVDIIDPRLYGLFLSENIFSNKKIFEYIDIIDEDDNSYKEGSKKALVISSIAPHLNKTMLNKYFDISSKLKISSHSLQAMSSLYPYLEYYTRLNIIKDIINSIDNMNDISYIKPIFKNVDKYEKEVKELMEFLVNRFSTLSDNEVYYNIIHLGEFLSKLFFKKSWERVLTISDNNTKLKSLIILALNYNGKENKFYIDQLIKHIKKSDEFTKIDNFYYIAKLINKLDINQKKFLLKKSFEIIDRNNCSSIESFIFNIVPHLDKSYLDSIEELVKISSGSPLSPVIKHIIVAQKFQEIKNSWTKKAEDCLNKNWDSSNFTDVISYAFFISSYVINERKDYWQSRAIKKLKEQHLNISFFEESREFNWNYITDNIMDKHIKSLIDAFSIIIDAKSSILALTKLALVREKPIVKYKTLIYEKIFFRSQTPFDSLVFIKEFFTLINLNPDKEFNLLFDKIESIYNNSKIADENLYSVAKSFTITYAKLDNLKKSLHWRSICLSRLDKNFKIQTLSKLDSELSDNLIITKNNKLSIFSSIDSSYLKVKIFLKSKKIKNALAQIDYISNNLEKLISLIEIGNVQNSKETYALIESSANLINLLSIDELNFILSKIKFPININLFNIFINSRNLIKEYPNNENFKKQDFINSLTYKIPINLFNNIKIIETLLQENTIVYLSKNIPFRQLNTGFSEKIIAFSKKSTSIYFPTIYELSKRSPKLVKKEFVKILNTHSDYNSLKWILPFLKFKQKRYAKKIISSWENPFEKIHGLFLLKNKIKHKIIAHILAFKNKTIKNHLSIESYEITYNIWHFLDENEQANLLCLLLKKPKKSNSEIDIIIKLFE
ncbi:MAG: hypothetical protein ABF289_05520, partial [Clostridiales bacterium]